MSSQYLGTVASSGTTQNNTGTATPFTLPTFGTISVQPDADGYVSTGSASVTATASGAGRGVKVSADQLFDIALSSADVGIAFLPVSGSGNLFVFSKTSSAG